MDIKNFTSKNMSLFIDSDDVPSSSLDYKMSKKELFNVEMMSNYLSHRAQKSYDVKASLSQAPIKETSLERIERKLDQLSKDVATRDDIIAHTKVLLGNEEKMNNELQAKLEILRTMQMANVPHKRLATEALTFLLFFAVSFLLDVFFGVVIVTRFWSNVGLLFSFGFLIMSQAMKKDWSELIKPRNDD